MKTTDRLKFSENAHVQSLIDEMRAAGEITDTRLGYTLDCFTRDVVRATKIKEVSSIAEKVAFAVESALMGVQKGAPKSAVECAWEVYETFFPGERPIGSAFDAANKIMSFAEDYADTQLMLLRESMQGAAVISNHAGGRIRELEAKLADAQKRLKGAGMLGSDEGIVGGAE